MNGLRTKVNGDDELFHGLVSDQVFWMIFEHFFIRRVIPDAVRIDNGDLARPAHFQAVSLRAAHAISPVVSRVVELFFNIVPSFQASLPSASGLARSAQKDVAP
jgi:hypothetical protein